jgi:hypothetical protein
LKWIEETSRNPQCELGEMSQPGQEGALQRLPGPEQSPDGPADGGKQGSRE